MDEFPIAAIGTIGWLLLIMRDTFRGCAQGHWPSALLSMVIHTLLTIEIWAIGPAQLRHHYADSLWPITAIYSAAILPYVYFFVRLATLSISQDTLRQTTLPSSPSTERKGDND